MHLEEWNAPPYKKKNKSYSREKKTTPLRCSLPASSSKHRPRHCESACMTSVGIWGSSAHSWLAATREGGVPDEDGIVEWSNGIRDDSCLGYKFCQPAHCAARDSTRWAGVQQVNVCFIRLANIYSSRVYVLSLVGRRLYKTYKCLV